MKAEGVGKLGGGGIDQKGKRTQCGDCGVKSQKQKQKQMKKLRDRKIK